MDEKDVVERLGPPDEIVPRKDGMRHHAWRCATCGEIIIGIEPVPMPAPCPRCGEIVFTVFRNEQGVVRDDRDTTAATR